MDTCCIVSHRNASELIRPLLLLTLRELIETCGIRMFLIKYQNEFDRIALSVLRDLKATHEEIAYKVVLTRPSDIKEVIRDTGCQVICPTESETQPLISDKYCETWMFEQSDTVLIYAESTHERSAKLARMANRLGKKLIFLT